MRQRAKSVHQGFGVCEPGSQAASVDSTWAKADAALYNALVALGGGLISLVSLWMRLRSQQAHMAKLIYRWLEVGRGRGPP
eukprot:15466296-Alexandrium_andersonii.AAC.1